MASNILALVMLSTDEYFFDFLHIIFIATLTLIDLNGMKNDGVEHCKYLAT